MSDTQKASYAHDVWMSRNDLLVKLGERIRKMRLRKGMNQTEFASHSGLSRGHISEIEHGKREPGLFMLQTIAAGLDISMSALLKGL
jgi:transcriptional regulator with XRE-family HTH domain